MPTRDSAWPAGTPCWIDYGAADVEAAKTFYAGVLGWTYTGGEPEYGGYLTCRSGERAAAGMGPQADPDDPPRWTTFFATEDAAATAARISDAGGSVHMQPMDVGPLGRMVVARDPLGYPFGAWESGVHTGIQIYNEPGALVWNEARVDDPDAAMSFYGTVFGFEFRKANGMGEYWTIMRDGAPLAGLGLGAAGAASGWTSCFSVASADEAVTAVERGGGAVAHPPIDMPFGRFAVVQDPWAATFSVMAEPPG